MVRQRRSALLNDVRVHETSHHILGVNSFLIVVAVDSIDSLVVCQRAGLLLSHRRFIVRLHHCVVNGPWSVRLYWGGSAGNDFALFELVHVVVTHLVPDVFLLQSEFIFVKLCF